MSLAELDLPAVMETSNFSLSKEFFIPVLEKSVRYERGVGYFTSGWIGATAKGLVPFIERGGVARWITSPLLNEEDYGAFALGVAASQDERLFELLASEVDNLHEAIERELLLTLAWMVADERLIFKIAVPTEKLAGGDFHDKFGIFTDTDGHRLSFNGSYNDTAKGELNYESIKIFKSWESNVAAFVENDAKRFDDLWYGRDQNLRIYRLPAAIKEKIIKYREIGDRPYDSVPIAEVPEAKEKETITLRPYQEVAVEEWISSNHRGILEMATGTGKTITSLFCAKEFFLREKYGVAVVLCPYIHLVSQWQKEIDRFGYDTLLCLDKSKDWIPEFQTKMQSTETAKALGIEKQRNLIVICTNKTFLSDKFQSLLAKTKLKKMVLADEVHNIGTKFALSRLPHDSDYRLALSATPQRFGDHEGTEGLFDYFGGIIYTLDLYDAIFKLDVLSHYEYEIHTAILTEEEFQKYREITVKIAQLLGKEQDLQTSEKLEKLLGERAEVLNTASAKIEILRNLLKQRGKIKKTLFYCAPKQLDQVNKILTKEFQIIAHQITYKENRKQRDVILKNFEDDHYQALTAIRCLDEGLDIPDVELAYILASSSNPREFIQRRGRILRKTDKKKTARIVDIIAIPPDTYLKKDLTEGEYRAEKSLLAREMKRIHYFANCADNDSEAVLRVYDLAAEYDLQHVLLGSDQ